LKNSFDDLIPDVKDNEPLQFELHLNGFKIKGLSPDKVINNNI